MILALLGRKRIQVHTIGDAYGKTTQGFALTVNILDAERRTVASTSTMGLMGLWSVDDLPAGGYTVVFVGAGDEISGWRQVIKIIANAENEAANQSLQLLHEGDTSKRPSR